MSTGDGLQWEEIVGVKCFYQYLSFSLLFFFNAGLMLFER